jgi:hypothetical protein
MSERTSPATLFLGSVVSGLSAAVVGPVSMYTSEVVLRFTGNPVATHHAPGSALLMGIFFGTIGVVVALFIGLPILLLLRNARRLSLSLTATAGGAIGLLVAMFFWIFDDAEKTVLLAGGVVGMCCGWVALAVAYLVPLRPNKSLERTREG